MRMDNTNHNSMTETENIHQLAKALELDDLEVPRQLRQLGLGENLKLPICMSKLDNKYSISWNKFRQVANISILS